MKLLLDEDMPLRAAALLRQSGIDAFHVLEQSLGGSTDEYLIELAAKQNTVIATLDADFHRLMASSHATRPSVIRVRVDGLPASTMANLLESVLQSAAESLDRGAVVSVTLQQMRVRLLPLHP